MGYNTWNVIERDVSEIVLREMADAMVDLGLRDVGYQYINVDDLWEASNRDADGSITPDPKSFPHGMKPVADYIHSRGLRFGLYSCPGPETCAGRGPSTTRSKTYGPGLSGAWTISSMTCVVAR